jgi:hypothetical protein
MRLSALLFCLLFFAHSLLAQDKSPLSWFSDKWDDAQYLACNTAAHASYMNDSEKTVIYILNLARMNPKLFCETVLRRYPDINSDYNYKSSPYFNSLIRRLNITKPLGILSPDSACWASAYEHAASSGESGYVGHERQTEKAASAKHFMGECCDYGHNKPIDIVMSLLIDQDVESLGHREICLGAYTKIGVAIHTHSQYRFTSTLDLYY